MADIIAQTASASQPPQSSVMSFKLSAALLTVV